MTSCREDVIRFVASWAVGVLLLCTPVTGWAQAPIVRVGVVLDGPWERNAELMNIFGSEIRDLIRGEFDLQFPEDKRIESDFTLAGVSRAVDALLADPDVDFVLTLGPVASAHVCRLGPLDKPVVAAFVLDPDVEGIPVSRNAQGVRVSGVRNLSYITFPSDFPRALRRFAEITPFRKLAFLGNEGLMQAIPELGANLRQETRDLNVELTVVMVGGSVGEALAAIPEDADAVYVVPLLQLPPGEFDRLVAGLIERKLPSFSYWGRGEVEAGLLTSIYLDTDFVRLGRRLAISMQRMLLGEDGGTLPVDFGRSQRLTVNMTTARAIGVYPSWSVYTEAELLQEDRSDVSPQLTLASTVAAAVAANLDLAVADREVLAGQQEIRAARASLFPQFGISGFGQFIDPDRAEAGFGGQPQRLVVGSATLSQLLYSEPVRANIDIQTDIQRARSHARDQTRLDIIRDGAVAYLDVLRARTFEGIQRENLTVTRTNLELAQSRQDIGVARASEVIRWETQIANNRRDVIDASALRNQAEIALNRVLHRPLEEAFGIAEAELDDPALATGTAQLAPFMDNPFAFDLFRDFMTLEALAGSPELRQLDAAIATQERNLLSTRRAFWRPQVALEADVSTLGKGGAGSAVDLGAGLPFAIESPNRLNWTVGLSASLPLFTGGARRAARDGASEELAARRLERRAAAERIEQRIRSTLHRAGASFAGIQLAEDAAAAGRRNLELVTDAYQAGAVSILDLLDAQNAALVAGQIAANAVYDYLVDLMNVERASGRFDFFTPPAEHEAFLERLRRYFVGAGYPVERP